MALATSNTGPHYLGAQPITIAEFAELLDLAAITKETIMVSGAPGVAKSQRVIQWCADNDYGHAMLVLSSCAQEDVQGIPTRVEDRIARLLVGPLALACERRCVLHVEEATLAIPGVLGAILSLISERRAGDQTLHPETFVVLTFNPPSCTAGATDLPAPLVGRGAHYALIPNSIDVTGYFRAQGDKVAAAQPVLARWYRLAADLIDLAPERLIEFTPPVEGDRSWAMPRQIEAAIVSVAAMEGAGRDPLTDPLIHKIFRARLGEKVGNVWVGTLVAAAKLPNPREIAKNPDAAPTPSPLSDLDLALACVAMISTVIQIDGAAAYVWSDRFTAPEMRTLLSRALSNAGARPPRGFTGPLTARAEKSVAALAASINAAAAGRAR